MEKFSYEHPRLWVCRRREPILDYISKKVSGSNGLNYQGVKVGQTTMYFSDQLDIKQYPMLSINNSLNSINTLTRTPCIISYLPSTKKNE